MGEEAEGEAERCRQAGMRRKLSTMADAGEYMLEYPLQVWTTTTLTITCSMFFFRVPAVVSTRILSTMHRSV